MEFILFICVVVFWILVSNIRSRLVHLEDELRSVKNQLEIVDTKNTFGVARTGETVSVSGAENLLHEAMQAEAVSVTDKVQTHDIPVSSITSEEVGGRWLGRIGIIAVLIGVSFFIKYAFDNNWIGPLGRVIVGLSLGTLAIVLGQILRKTYQNYSDMLIGGGVGVLYLSAYSGFFFYHLFEAPFAYLFLLVITTISVALSLFNESKTLAVISVIGGFLTPLLVSLTSSNYVELLTYMLVVNIGVVIISYLHKWIELNHVAFIGTTFSLIVSATSTLSTFEVFGFKLASITFYSYAFVYFLIFLAAAIAHHVVRKESSTKDDIAFILMNGLSHGFVGYFLLNPVYPGLMGYFMLAMSILYGAVAYVSYVTHKEDSTLNFFLVGMSVGFLTASIPLHFDGSWIAILWFVEAIVFYVIDKKLKGKNLYSYGSVIYILGLIQVCTHNAFSSVRDEASFANVNFGLYILAIGTAYVLAAILHADKSTADKQELISLKRLYLGIANLLTLFAITSEISRYYNSKLVESGYFNGENERIYSERNTAISIFWMLYAIALLAVGFVVKVRYVRIFGLGLFFVTTIKLFFDIFSLGPLYAIVSSITLGALALAGSFGYAKYSEKLKKLI